MHKKFFVTGLPRSMSAWFSVFLSDYKRMHCMHESSKSVHTHKEYMKRLERMHLAFDYVGDASSVIPWFPVYKYFPDAKVVIIERDIDDVLASLERITNLTPGGTEMVKRTNGLLKVMPGFHVKYEDVHDRIEEIWEHLFDDVLFPSGRYVSLRNMKIEAINQRYNGQAITDFITDKGE